MTNVAHAVFYNRDAFFPGNGLPDVTIGNLPYWEESTVSTLGYSTASQTARTKYDEATDADIDFYRVYDGNAAAVRVFAGDYGEVGWWGIIIPYDVNGFETDEYNAWKFVNMFYNDGQMDRDGFTEANRTYNAIHEWGHALSMKHQDSQSVMVQGKLSLTAPTSIDYSNLNYMY
jgi:hypothetical protein